MGLKLNTHCLERFCWWTFAAFKAGMGADIASEAADLHSLGLGEAALVVCPIIDCLIVELGVASDLKFLN